MSELKPCPFNRITHTYTDGRAWIPSAGLTFMGEGELVGPAIDRLALYESLLQMEPAEAALILRRAQPANDKARLIDANTLSDEISRLQIFLSGESLFTPAIKETVLRTIDEQATVTVAQPANEPLTLEQLREMNGEPVWLNVADGKWGLVNSEAKEIELSQCGFIEWEKVIGVAYRRQPERSENDG